MLLAKNLVSVGLTAVLALFCMSACSESDSKPKKTSAKKDELGGVVIDVNNASLGDLQKLPGVGEVTAKRIIAARPFTKVDDLQNVEGIGEKTFQDIKPHVEVKAPAAKPDTPAPVPVPATPPAP